MSETKKRELYLRVAEERQYGYFHITVKVCEQRYEQGTGFVPYGVDDSYEYGPKFSDLRIRCQGDERSQRDTERGEPVYGYDVTFEDVTVDLRVGRRMMKTLELVERGLRKLEETRGRARTFPEYVGRVAEILKCKGMCHDTRGTYREQYGQKWEWTNIGDGVREIANRIWRWQEEAKPAAAASGTEQDGQEAAS